MATTVYRSTDASAPVLTGQAGSLVALLDAVLVNGYGAKPAAGWTKPFSAANKAVYKCGGASAGVPPIQYYLDVDDSGPNVTDTFKSARMRGYETMTAVATGTNPFPAAGTNQCCRKSATADATARPWIIVADKTTFYVFVSTGDLAATYFTFGFGEYYSYIPGDQYKFFLLGRSEANAGVAGGGLATCGWASLGPSLQSIVTNFICARPFTGTGLPTATSRSCPWNQNAAGPGTLAFMAGSGLAYPNPVDGGLLMAPINIWTQPSGGSLGLHGQHRGLYVSPHGSSPFNDGDTFDGVGDYAGRSFLVVKSIDANNSSNSGAAVIVETTDWARSS